MAPPHDGGEQVERDPSVRGRVGLHRRGQRRRLPVFHLLGLAQPPPQHGGRQVAQPGPPDPRPPRADQRPEVEVGGAVAADARAVLALQIEHVLVDADAHLDDARVREQLPQRRRQRAAPAGALHREAEQVGRRGRGQLDQRGRVVAALAEVRPRLRVEPEVVKGALPSLRGELGTDRGDGRVCGGRTVDHHGRPFRRFVGGRREGVDPLLRQVVQVLRVAFARGQTLLNASCQSCLGDAHGSIGRQRRRRHVSIVDLSLFLFARAPFVLPVGLGARRRRSPSVAEPSLFLFACAVGSVAARRRVACVRAAFLRSAPAGDRRFWR